MRRAGACTFACDPSLDCSRAAPIWSADQDPTVISARAYACDGSTAHSLQIDHYDHCVAIDDRAEHLLLRAAGTSLRFDIVSGTVFAGPVVLEPSIALDRLECQIAAVRSLAAILRDEPPPTLADARLPRLVLALRALDARRDGASLRNIARGIFGVADWPGDGDYIKSRARRLMKLSEALWEAGPRGVLTHAI